MLVQGRGGSRAWTSLLSTPILGIPLGASHSTSDLLTPLTFLSITCLPLDEITFLPVAMEVEIVIYMEAGKVPKVHMCLGPNFFDPNSSTFYRFVYFVGVCKIRLRRICPS